MLRTSWVRLFVRATSHLPLVFAPVIVAELHGEAPPSFDLWLACSLLTVAVLTLAAGRRHRVVLGAGRITARSGFRARTLAATDIQAVTVEREAGSRMVTVWPRIGKPLRLAAAGRTEGLVKQNFDCDFHLIGQWWLANGGQPNQGRAWGPPAVAAGSWVPEGFDWRPPQT